VVSLSAPDAGDLSELADHLSWLVPPLALLLYWRLRRSPNAVRAGPARRRRPQSGTGTAPLAALLAHPGRARAGAATGRNPGRPSSPVRAPASSAGVTREEMIDAYYRWRYAPAEGPQERALPSSVRSYMAGVCRE